MKQLFYLSILLCLIALFWQHAILYPLKLLVVFFHESSHALATIVTGGRVKEFVILKEQGGYVISQGGNRSLILSAGYIGSLIWGIVIFIASVSSRYDKALVFCLGISVIAITVLLSSDLFSWVFGLITGVTFLLSGVFLNQQFNDFLLRLIALTSMLYAPLDIFSDTISRSHLKSDAFMLAEHIGGTTVLWGSVWIMLSFICIVFCLRWYLRKKPGGSH